MEQSCIIKNLFFSNTTIFYFIKRVLVPIYDLVHFLSTFKIPKYSSFYNFLIILALIKKQ